MADYKDLNSRPAEAFLKPKDFKTLWDRGNQRQYDTGKALKNNGFTECGISSNGTWYASAPSNNMSSCEGIGYHADTALLLQGMLDSGLPFFVYRIGKGKTQISGPVG